ncbi:hypothetical protein EVAR_45260_1 [Eumeta japonica]|uniref:Uncharacterized protein n=1 Tax=Eumeta variegata TaxID=151549 RepID=A0A4C1XBG8_EUMVA|nr:hypothetical protein EVAR_45260_1 [Eumeta japonica]
MRVAYEFIPWRWRLIRGREPRRSLRYDRESVYQVHVALIRANRSSLRQEQFGYRSSLEQEQFGTEAVWDRSSLGQEQFGFRNRHSNTLQLARVLHYMTAEHNRGRSTVGIFLDIEKTLDRVWRSTKQLPIACLFATFTDDIPLPQANYRTGRRMSCLHYMDDSAYLASSRRADL